MGDETLTKSTDRYRARIARTLVILEADHGEKMTLDDLANAASMSRFHFHRVFGALTGETVGAVARRFRLTRGLRRLRDSEMSITEIALDVGYNSSQNFAKSFKAVTGATPSEARRDTELAKALFHRLAKPRFIMMKDCDMSDVEIKTLRAFSTIGIQHVGQPDKMGAVFHELMSWIGGSGLIPEVVGLYSVYHNDPTESATQELRAAACVELRGAVKPGTGMDTIALGGGEHAVLVHRGSYETMKDSYDTLYGRWLPASGREPANKPPFEKYLNDPTTTPSKDLRTEIYLPLKQADDPMAGSQEC